MGIEALGPIAVDDDTGFLARRERIVLGVLVVCRDRVVSAETLADALWPDGAPATWTKVVQGCVVRLRKRLGAGAIATSDLGYRLAVPSEDIDAHRFERLVARARELLDVGEPDRAAYLADEALALWRGAPLPELEGWEPGRIEAVRLTELRLDAEDLRLDAAVRTGRHRQVLAEARAMVGQAPLRERRWELLALAQYQAGRQAEALQTLRQARQVMITELGLDPGPGLVAMEEAILRQDPGLLSAHLPEAVSECPYLGLVPYDVDDAEEFFGREQEVADCLRRLADAGVLVVIGPSGSGKSSLVRAGVAAALRRDGERVVVVTPGARPMAALSALPATGRPPVLLVDQAEEAVALAEDDAERAEFFAALAVHAEHAPLIVAMRADRLGALTAYLEFARLVERGLYLLKAMDGDQLRAAIEAPARQAGLLLEPGLVDLLVRDVEGEPGSLPLLSHALRQTWLGREGSTLTVEGYQSSGGIRGAVAQSAEAVYDAASEPEQRMLREMFLRLVTPTTDGAPVRSRLHREVVAPDADRAAVVEKLVQARLVTSDEDTVEIAHEALARAWPRLRGWLDDDVEGHRIWGHLATSAQAWSSMGRPSSELYRGVRLARAVEWHARSGTDLTAVEREFLAASEAAHRSEIDRAEEETRQAEAEAARQARLNRRLKVLVAVVGVLTLLAATAGAIAMRQAGRADLQAAEAQREAERADAEAGLARSHELAASSIATMTEDAALARLLAVAAADAAPPNLQSTAALHRAWAADAAVSRRSMAFNAVGWPDLHPATITWCSRAST